MNLSSLLASWPLQPTVILGVLIGGALYWAGAAYSTRRGLAHRHRWWHSASFYAGLIVVLVALNGPIDALADQLFWAHMLQHELLVLLAAPLLLFGEPLMLMWRAVPLGARRASLEWFMTQRWPRRIWEGVAHIVGTPVVAWALFLAVFLSWHVPALYDLALLNTSVHVLEHVMFLGAALLFWAQVVPSRPLRQRLGYVAQLIYVGTAALVMNFLAAVYMYSTAPMYPYYAELPRASGAMPALVDQHIAGAVMDAPCTILFFLAICTLLLLWLREDERASSTPEPAGARPSGGRWGTTAAGGGPEM
jgi:putative membrane protein